MIPDGDDSCEADLMRHTHVMICANVGAGLEHGGRPGLCDRALWVPGSLTGRK